MNRECEKHALLIKGNQAEMILILISNEEKLPGVSHTGMYTGITFWFLDMITTTYQDLYDIHCIKSAIRLCYEVFADFSRTKDALECLDDSRARSSG